VRDISTAETQNLLSNYRLDKVNETVDRMDEMMSSLLQLTKEGDTISETSEVDLETVARDSWDGISTEETTLSIESTMSFQADPKRLREVLDHASLAKTHTSVA